MAYRFLEGEELIKAVREKLGIIETPDSKAALAISSKLLYDNWKVCANDGELALGHAYAGAPQRCL